MAFEATLDLLTLRRDGVDASQWPRLSCSQAQQAALAGGDLRLDAGREVLFQDQGQIPRLRRHASAGVQPRRRPAGAARAGRHPLPHRRPRPQRAAAHPGHGPGRPWHRHADAGPGRGRHGQGHRLPGERRPADTSVTDTTKVAKAGDTMIGALTLTAAGTGLTVANNAAVGGTLTVTGNVGIGTTSLAMTLRGGVRSWRSSAHRVPGLM